jgi:hypothetical protein
MVSSTGGVSAYWQKTRYHQTMSYDDSSAARAEGTPLSPLLQLHAIATLNDQAVRLLRVGHAGIALQIFGEAFVKAGMFSAEDDLASRNRSVAFSEVIPSSSSSQHYLVPVRCMFGVGAGDDPYAGGRADAPDGGGDDAEGTLFAKAILLCQSHFPATVHTVKDVLLFHHGLCRHLQALEASSRSSLARRDVLYKLAAKRYTSVQKHVPLVRAAACYNLTLCRFRCEDNRGGGDIGSDDDEKEHRQQAFRDAFQDLIDPAEIAEFRDYFIHTARAA